MVAFYQHSEDQAGFHYNGSAWSQFGAPLGPSSAPESGGYSVSAAASVAAAPNQIYAVESDTNVLSISSDGGLTWTQRTITGLPSSLPSPSIFSLWAPAVGEVYLNESRGSGSIDGIWRTLDDGLTWSRIVAFSLGLNLFGDHLALGTSKVFYDVCTARTSSSTTFDFHRCNLDGTGVETWASHTFSAVVSGIQLRAISDDFVLAATYAGVAVWRIDASGIHDVRPTALGAPWDVLPLTASEWLAVGQATPTTSADVLVYRTTNAGTSWTLTTTIASLQGFARNGRSDSYAMISAPQPGSPSEVVMLGHADYNVQQIFWTSTDAGVTWSQLLNAAEPYVDEWLVYGPGGLASVCTVAPQMAVPSRLATIVG